MDKFNFFVLIKILFNNNKSDIEKILTENLTVDQMDINELLIFSNFQLRV